MIVFGGLSLSTNANARAKPSSMLKITEYNDIWRLSLSSGEGVWSKDANSNHTVTDTEIPSPRSEAGSAIHDNKLFIFGGISYRSSGFDSPVDMNDLWSYDLETKTWKQLRPSDGIVPPRRFSHSVTLTVQSGLSYLLVYSGRHLQQTSWSMLDDTWLYSLSENRWIRVQSSSTTPRMYTSIVTTGDTDFWFFGGYYRPVHTMSGYVFDDTVSGELNIRLDSDSDSSILKKGSALARPTTKGASMKLYTAVAGMNRATPPLRYNHQAVAWNEAIVVYGGSYQTVRGDVWSYNTTNAVLLEDVDMFPKKITSLIYFLGGLIAVIVVMLLLLLLRWRQVDQRNLQMRQVRGSNTRGVSQERMQQLEILKYKKPVKSVDPACVHHNKDVSVSSHVGSIQIPICLNFDEDVCPICLVEFEEEENVRKLNCTHIFHVPCIDEWLRRNVTCPMCKDIVETVPGQEQQPANSTSRRFSVVPLLNPRNSSQSLIVPFVTGRVIPTQIPISAAVAPTEVVLAPRIAPDDPHT
uniref:Uncharacterized protein AlNc14C9G1164 n=1 Tax=Albugo laibachii Nc14 TaxID=890382 RepID=F0W2B4_9STRA|nr:conserved hypothetical protein [Albugo laibachii Nc14]|eukprot:CCA15199.1 conserved hypothetical protein [Albugo laibachii Nc14]